MGKTKKLFVAAALMGSVAGGATNSYAAAPHTPEDEVDESIYTVDLLKVGEEAPNFVLANGDTHAGESLTDFRGKYVVIDFWASYCIDCRRDLPEFKEVHATFASDDVVFIGVSFDRSEEAWRNYLKENEMTWIQHWETTPWKESPIASGYHLTWIPTIYVIDQEGKVAFTTIHAAELKEFLSGLQQKR